MSAPKYKKTQNQKETIAAGGESEKRKPVDRKKQFRGYMGLKYTPEIEQRKSKNQIYFAATIPEFPGLLGTGRSNDEAIADLEEARKLYIIDLMAENEPIPLPKPSLVKITIFQTGLLPDKVEITQPFVPIIRNYSSEEEVYVEPQIRMLPEGITLGSNISEVSNLSKNTSNSSTITSTSTKALKSRLMV